MKHKGMKNKRGEMDYPILKLIGVIIGVLILILVIANIGSLGAKMNSIFQRFMEIWRFR